MTGADSPKSNKKYWLRHLCFFVASIVVPFVIAALTFELHLAVYLLRTGETRAQQSENYGLGFEGFLVAGVAWLVSWVAVFVLWALSERKK
jgi:hypothetical protein